MRELERNDYIFGISLLVLGAVLFVGLTSQGAEELDVDWRNVTLQDVNTGEEFRISELDKPLYIETFAVWCPTCTNQQQEFKKLHEDTNITSISLDVDPQEDAEQIRRHTEENGFDWRYAVSPSNMTRALISDFGTTVSNPPSAPVILVCEDSSRRITESGVKTASKLEQEARRGC